MIVNSIIAAYIVIYFMIPSHIKKINSKSIPDNKEIRLFVIVRNESLRLPYFFRYYFEKGVDRIFLIDNDSTDNTIDISLSESNVHVFHVKESYKNHWNWKTSFLNHFGKNKWCVIVDADEIFYFPGSNKLSIKDLCDYMDQEKYTAIRCFLLDMYSNKSLIDTHYKSGQNPIEVCPYFDSDFNTITWQFLNIKTSELFPFKSFFGGMRKRIFGLYPCLTKIPLFYNKESAYISLGMHAIDGVELSDINGTVLHFKYFSDLYNKAYVESERKVY